MTRQGTVEEGAQEAAPSMCEHMSCIIEKGRRWEEEEEESEEKGRGGGKVG